MREPNATERAEIDFYLELGDESLLVELGRAARGRDGVQLSPKSALLQARQWLKDQRETFRMAVCMNWSYCEKREDKKLADTHNLIVSVADIIVGAAGGVPVLMVATQLARMGLDEFCDC